MSHNLGPAAVLRRGPQSRDEIRPNTAETDRQTDFDERQFTHHPPMAAPNNSNDRKRAISPSSDGDDDNDDDDDDDNNRTSTDRDPQPKKVRTPAHDPRPGTTGTTTAIRPLLPSTTTTTGTLPSIHTLLAEALTFLDTRAAAKEDALRAWTRILPPTRE
jgi:hypothetical protein